MEQRKTPRQFESSAMPELAPRFPITGEHTGYSVQQIEKKLEGSGQIATQILRVFISVQRSDVNRSPGTYEGCVNPSNAEAIHIQSTRMQIFLKTSETLSCWYSLNSSRCVVSDEYPCAGDSLIFQFISIISRWPN